MLETEYAKVEYDEETNIVVHTWKKKCEIKYNQSALEQLSRLR